MVEVGDGSFSRELCGGTHVHATAEIGVFKITAETSSAANVRRIEALTGPEAVRLLRGYDEQLSRAAATLRVPANQVADTVTELRARLRELERKPKAGPNGSGGGIDSDALVAAAEEIDGVPVLATVVEGADQNTLLELSDRVKGRLGDAVVVLGSAAEGRVALVANVAPAVVERGVRADAVVRAAAEVVGGGGGGRDTLARAGGRDPEKLQDALVAARQAIEAALTS
jgi:alanyl-tRNA synthetase